ncbi:MFS transporter [Burkholderia metallica]|uniref:MFS transporter n=1 Tax=Burkholderia metallica TaxID=488729 RepID=A0ABT8PCB4_9BURK|nr:MFS transporter [Burkholderia metallica]MDN7932492.1 MFS transporter [Burkholderia metallica]
MTADAPQLHAATMRRLNLRLIPFLMLLYLVAYIDRSNISVAALQMNADLGLSAEMYGLGAGLFYVTYILFEVPSNLFLARVGARRWIARIMITWGVVAAAMSAVHTPGQLYAMRLLLGAAEAGFTPGIIYYLSAWYPPSDRARAMSFFYIGATLASVIGLPLSGALLNLNGVLGLEGWRWLFLLEGVPALPFLFACVAMYVNGRHSDLGGERALHLGVPMLLAGALLIAAIYTPMLPVAYALLVLAVGFNWAATPVFWAVTTEYVSGLTAAASIALINAVANIAGLALPPVMGRIKDVTHSYDLALLLVAAALLAGGVLALRIASRRAMPVAAGRAG